MSTPSKRVAFHTLGCKLNYSETSSISRDFIVNGFKKVKFKDVADIYVINTCSVTENADKEARKLIRQSKRRNQNSSIVVIGCYAQLQPGEINSIDDVDLVLGTNEKFNILKHLDKLDLSQNGTKIHTEIKNSKVFHSSYSLGERTRAYLKVQDGCDYTCSFCTIPLARGKSRSDSINRTIKVAKQIARSGKKEVVLTGVNVGDFGKKQNESFHDLIKSLDEISGINRIRISSIEPNLITDEIIDFCLTSKHFVPHFHIPLQSGSDRILRLMRRRYDTGLYYDRIKKIKSVNRDTCIGVDVIVGFPGETENDFIATYDYLNSLEISYLHVFSYSERLETDAINMDDKVSSEIKKERSRALHQLSNQKQIDFTNQFINSKRKVLFEYRKDGALVGHTDNYLKVHTLTNNDLINQIVPVSLVEYRGGVIFGEL
tara:strand:+ start:1356 stop:2648 length:1293 start_codon:yes stop_codon:yes gene_type:complete